jgi:hypothetical protein
MGTQVCKKCGIEKSVSEFGKAGKRQLKSGEWKQYYHTTCKQCVNSPRVRKDNVDPKVCNKCGVSKPLSEYAYEPNRDRYRGDCKQCKYEKRLKYRVENPEVIERERERNRWRYSNVEGVRERAREVSDKSRAKHKDRRNEEQRDRYANDLEYAEKIKQERRDRWANMTDDEKKEHKLKTDQWIENNKERYVEYKKHYQIDNREWISERSKKHRKENPEHHKKLRKANYEKHQEKLVEGQKRIRKERRQYLREYLGGKCVRCGATERLDFDHIIPANKSYTIGSNITCFSIEELILEVDKCQLLCRPCHIQKGIENGDYVGPKGLPEEVKKRRIKK